MSETMKRHKVLIIVLSLAVGGMCMVACIVVGALMLLFPSDALVARTSLQVGETAPDFQLATLTGETVSLSQFRGRPVLLVLGATWCPECRLEAPVLQKFHERGLPLVILMIDSKEEAQTVQEFADEFGLTYPIGLDLDGAVARAYHLWYIPTGLLIDEDGVVRSRTIGAYTEDSLATMLEQTGIAP